MTPRSVWVHSARSLAPERPELLRLALAGERLLAENRGLPGAADIRVLPAGSAASLRAEIGPQRLVFEVPELCLRPVPSTAVLAQELRRALSDARRAEPAVPVPAARPAAPSPMRTRRRPSKALFFRSLLNSPDKELGAEHMYQGVFYIASALRRAGHPFVLVDGRISLRAGEMVTDRDALDRALAENPDVNFIGLSLYDDYFEKAARLIRYLRRRSRAFIAVGGYMPTLTPYEVMAHLPDAQFLVRGAGEEVVPRILSILGGCDRRVGLDRDQIEALRGLEGVLYGNVGTLLLAGADRTNRISDLDRSELDFSLLEKRHTTSGTVLCVSRGCPYHCLFCTSSDKGRFAGKSPAAVARILGGYGRRLRQLYGNWNRVPSPAFGIGFYDDDFLSDRDRAIAIFRVFQDSPFFVQFIQTSVNSLFLRENGRPGDLLDDRLLDAMPESLFHPKFGRPQARPYLYIGTENYCDEELRRLGKPYGYARIETLVRELCRRRLRSAHHFIVSNPLTRVEQILENLVRIARLSRLSAGYYEVLRPPIPSVVSFYPSPHYRQMAVAGLLSCVKVRTHLRIPGFGEFDYPLVEGDVPLDPDAAELAGRLPEFATGAWEQVLGRVLQHLLRRSESLRWEAGEAEHAARLRAVVDRYSDYRERVLAESPAAAIREAALV